MQLIKNHEKETIVSTVFMFYTFGKDRVKAAIIKGKLELYDLAQDIGEQNNIANQHPDVVRTIETYLSTCRTDSPMWPVQTKNNSKTNKKINNHN